MLIYDTYEHIFSTVLKLWSKMFDISGEALFTKNVMMYCYDALVKLNIWSCFDVLFGLWSYTDL